MLKFIQKKPIYDIPPYPEILADDLAHKLIEQSNKFKPGLLWVNVQKQLTNKTTERCSF
jgi:hypothetical protein